MSQRVIFMGYNDTGYAVFKACVQSSVQPLAVIIPAGASTERTKDVAELGYSIEAQVYQSSLDNMHELAEFLIGLNPDWIILGSFPFILPKFIIDIPSKGIINVHGGLLPEQRGTHILNWAIALGLPYIGVTIHKVDEGIDTGPIYAKSMIYISESENASNVRDKLIAETKKLVSEHLPNILGGFTEPMPQDTSQARYFKKRSDRDGQILWSSSAQLIERLVRALVPPYPGAWFKHKNLIFRVAEAKILRTSHAAIAGTILNINGNTVTVALSDGAIQIVLSHDPVFQTASYLNVNEVLD